MADVNQCAATKTCTKCGTEKPHAEYPSRTVKGALGKRAQCRVCLAAYRRQYHKANPEQARENRQVNRAHRMWLSARTRAEESGVPFDIAPADVSVPVLCPVFGIRLESSGPGGGPASPTLDRIIPERGYVRGNVAVISQKANSLKGNGSAAQHRRIADWIDSQVPQ